MAAQVVFRTEPVLSPRSTVVRSVYCNRSLSLADIKFYGFDMDYTLALYKVRRCLEPHLCRCVGLRA